MEVRSGKVIAKPLAIRAEQLLAVLRNSRDADYQGAIEMLAKLPSEQLEALSTNQAEHLRRLARNESSRSRILAVRALGKTRNLDNVPTLIHALSDADPDVALEARDALRRISRKPSGFALPERPSDADRRTAIEKWKTWYLAVRPDAEFFD